MGTKVSNILITWESWMRIKVRLTFIYRTQMQLLRKDFMFVLAKTVCYYFNIIMILKYISIFILEI
jgi:hypothetical protein